jgi:YD repeat-containing protein
MLARYFLIVSLIALPYSGFTQNSSFAVPSPNSGFMGKDISGSATDVNLCTGTAQIGIPICSIADKDLSVPVSLMYTASKGVKIQDYPTCVGLGWQLNAGGSITRVVRGFPDENTNGFLGGGYGTLLYNYKANGGTINSTQATALGMGVLSNPTADGESDIYYITTPFFSGQFTFDGSGNPVFSNGNGLKISFANYLSFVVTDDGGNKYYFNTTETTSTKLYGNQLSFTTTWYLDQVISLNSKNTITFVYTPAPLPDTTYHYRRALTETASAVVLNDDNTPVTSIVTNPKYISSIVTSQGRIDFSYTFGQRRDHHTAGLLNSITTSSTVPVTTALRTYGFNYSYFGDPANDINILRLRLDKVTVAGNTATTATPVTLTSFTYNYSDNLPARNSPNFDYFGYYKQMPPPNYQFGVDFSDPMQLIQNRVPNFNNTKANILTGITDLSGSTTQFVYEQNDYYNTYVTPNANTQVGGLRVKQISKTDAVSGQTLTRNYGYNNSSGNSTGQILTPAYQLLQYAAPDGWTWTNYSETPSLYYDINGSFIGYSIVKVTEPNGGYTTSHFTNFNDFPDVLNQTPIGQYGYPLISSTISAAYKRGLMTSVDINNANGVAVSSDTYSYTSLTNPATNYSSVAYHAQVLGYGTFASGVGSLFWTNIENYRLNQVVHKDYDQLNTNNFIQSGTNFTYCPNKRSIQSVTTTDSKQNAVTKTSYHTDDTGIPMVTGAEQTAINTMLSLNVVGAVVHESVNKNGAITQSHNSYSVSVGNSTNPYLLSTSAYKGSTLLNTNNFIYETDHSNMISSYTTGSKSTGVLFGYNNVYPIAVVSNAGSSYSSQQSTGGFSNTFTSSYNTSFTSDYTGTIAWSVYGMGLSGTANVQYSLSGPSSQYGGSCIGTGCTSYATFSFPNMPPGTYSLTVFVYGSYTSYGFYASGGYPKNIQSLVSEYFYEGFETSSGTLGTTGNAHTGNRYYDGSASAYSVSYAIPNSRSYIIQWWNRDNNNKWIFNESSYTGPRTLSGIIDDIRIFPSDAQMQTFTYDPFVGRTGQTEPNGKTATYEYDGLGRINIVRDNDKNIVSKNCYTFLGQPIACSEVLPQVPITICCNGSGNGWMVYLTNVVTNQVYSSSILITPSYTIGTSFNVPAGTYNITIAWAYLGQGPVTGPYGGSHLLVFGSYNQYGTQSSMVLSNITISAPQTVSIPF